MPDPEAEPRSRYIPVDTITPNRVISHGHFAPGDRVVVIKGSARGDLCGTEMTIVAASWHTPTDEDGWRARDPEGGQRSYLTAHPRHLVHVEHYCPECTGYVRKLAEALLPQIPYDRRDGGWYHIDGRDQLVHNRDPKAGR
ncbi:hypothetical protein [Streptomyces sp. YIM 98790]|uniref:hypothetical protein n=1 Tax=Streptomyces sp. YIM 98790 TaxID=2689077 RepID=UPI00140A908E|nr:hypothetical protein [Streptomyces sp. YIM 98790]